MSWSLFFLCFLLMPVVLGWLIGRLLSTSAQIPSYIPNARANRVILLLVIVGIIYVALAPNRTIDEPIAWITLGVFLAAACINFSVMITHRIRIVSQQRQKLDR
jgi:hypothetical protein